MSPVDFTRELIKGRIAEVIFEQMIREEGRYTVIPFGYEHTVPTLSQYQHLAQIKDVIDKIKDAPDFALVSHDKTKVYLVEIKYRSHLQIEEIKVHANKLLKRWDPSWLLVATPEGFYCSLCKSIIETSKINQLSEKWVSSTKQSEYLQLLNEFRK